MWRDVIRVSTEKESSFLHSTIRAITRCFKTFHLVYYLRKSKPADSWDPFDGEKANSVSFLKRSNAWPDPFDAIIHDGKYGRSSISLEPYKVNETIGKWRKIFISWKIEELQLFCVLVPAHSIFQSKCSVTPKSRLFMASRLARLDKIIKIANGWASPTVAICFVLICSRFYIFRANSWSYLSQILYQFFLGHLLEGLRSPQPPTKHVSKNGLNLPIVSQLHVKVKVCFLFYWTRHCSTLEFHFFHGSKRNGYCHEWNFYPASKTWDRWWGQW